MSWLDGLRDRLRWLFRSREAEAQLEHELRFHLERETARLIETGVPPAEAARRAARSLGSVGRTKEAVRDQRGIGWLDDLSRDLGYAIRGLRRRPGFTGAVLATVAVGIGATAAVYSVADAVALRPLPYHDPDRLVAVWPDRSLSQAEHHVLRRESRSLVSVAGYAPWTMALTGVEDPTQVRAVRVSANLFETLGVPAALGRTFRPDEDRPGAPPVAVLSHAMWSSRFGGDSLVLGRQLTLDGTPYTIVGVMPRTFAVLAGRTDVWVPLPDDPSAWYYRSGVSLTIGRLAPGVTSKAGQADLARVLPLVRAELGLPESYGENARLVDLREYVTGQYRGLSFVLLGAVVGILLLAAANLAHLVVARATSRRPEMALRLALGARRARLARQLLTEGAVLAIAGAGLGLLLAGLLLGVFRGIAPDDTPRLAEVGLDATVAVVVAGLAVVMAIVLGLAQAAGSLSGRPVQSSRSAAGSDARATARTGGLLVVTETALAVTLVVGAGLMIRTLGQLAVVDPGFVHHGVLTLRVQPVYRRAAVDQFYRAVFERIQALPGVAAVGAIQHLPLSGTEWGIDLEIEGRPIPPGQERPRVGFRLIAGDYLGALGIPLRAGRGFDSRDGRGGPPVALVNEAMERRFWPGETAVGKRMRLGTDTTLVTIVGVVGDVRHSSLAVAPEPELYRPAAQSGMPALMIAVRATVPPMSLARAAQAAVWEVDPTVPVAEVMPFEALLRDSIGDRRLLAMVLAVFAVVALVVGAIGVFGVTSFAVSRQTREIGIRMALGATGGTVRAAVFRRGMGLVAGGIVVGLGTALALTRFLAAFLFEVGTTDPITFAGVAILLTAVAATAISGPAFRATRVDPVKVLRAE